MPVVSETYISKNVFSFTMTVAKASQVHIINGKTGLHLTPLDAAVDFKCVYETEVTVSSVDIKLNQPKVSGYGIGRPIFGQVDAEGNQGGIYDRELQIGSFNGGFKLNFFTDDAMASPANSAFYIGQTVYASIDWSVSSLQTLMKFYIDSCTISSEGVDVEIIKQNCYASELGVKQLQSDKMVAEKSKFQFISFTLATNALEASAEVSCSVKMCLLSENSCQIQLTTQDAACPVQEGFSFKANTF